MQGGVEILQLGSVHIKTAVSVAVFSHSLVYEIINLSVIRTSLLYAECYGNIAAKSCYIETQSWLQYFYTVLYIRSSTCQQSARHCCMQDSV